MPRKSAAAKLVAVLPVIPHLKMPHGMGAPERAIWHSAVASMPSGHFAPSDAPLLRAYCVASAVHGALLDRVHAEGVIVDGKGHPLLAEVRATSNEMQRLARALRLAPSSRRRIEVTTARPAEQRAAKRPWEKSQ